LTDEKLDMALQKLASAAADAQANAQRQPMPVPPDAELDELFLAFAKRMPTDTALPFIKHRIVTEQVRRGWFSKPSYERRSDPVELARGWPVGLGTEFGMGEERASGDVRDWIGLAIATDGRPWFAVRTPRDAQSLIVAGDFSTHSPWSKFAKIGRPMGSSLRVAIIDTCELKFYDETAPLQVDTGFNYHYTTRALDPNPLQRVVPCVAEALAVTLFNHGVRPP
jgi:hypothetical protein